jgi:alginate O-acetyltransferase complex protein AlgI
MHGLALAVERAFDAAVGSKPEDRSVPARIIGWFLTFNFVCLAWIFFRSPNLAYAMEYIDTMVDGTGSRSIVDPLILTFMAMGSLSQIVPINYFDRMKRLYERAPIGIQILVPSAWIWLVAVLAPVGIAPFIYFQF